MGKPGQFPTHDESEETRIKLLEQKISDRIAPLAKGNGGLVILLIPNRRAFASSRIYQAENGLRQLFVITEDSKVIAYMDVGLDRRRGKAVCGTTRNHKAPTEFGKLDGAGSSGDGFACESDPFGALLTGLAVYALKREGVAQLEVVRYEPDTEATDAFSSAGTKRSDFQSNVYNHVPNEMRELVADSLRFSA